LGLLFLRMRIASNMSCKAHVGTRARRFGTQQFGTQMLIVSALGDRGCTVVYTVHTVLLFCRLPPPSLSLFSLLTRQSVVLSVSSQSCNPSCMPRNCVKRTQEGMGKKVLQTKHHTLGMMVVRLAWMAATLVSSNSPTRYASVASCRGFVGFTVAARKLPSGGVRCKQVQG
jgi:hypothetical protein